MVSSSCMVYGASLTGSSITSACVMLCCLCVLNVVTVLRTIPGRLSLAVLAANSSARASAFRQGLGLAEANNFHGCFSGVAKIWCHYRRWWYPGIICSRLPVWLHHSRLSGLIWHHPEWPSIHPYWIDLTWTVLVLYYSCGVLVCSFHSKTSNARGYYRIWPFWLFYWPRP